MVRAQHTPLLSTAVCHVQNFGSGLLEMDLNYSFTDCHFVLNKWKALDSESANLVFSSNAFEVEEEGKRNKTLFISNKKLLLVFRICFYIEKDFECSTVHCCGEKNMLRLSSRDGMIQTKIVALKIKILIYIKDILLWGGQVCADRSSSLDPYGGIWLLVSL